MFTKHLVNTAELNGVIKDQKRKPLEREVDKDLAPASKRCVLIFLLFYFLFKTLVKTQGAQALICVSVVYFSVYLF
jgi:hypothetical protein